MAELKPQILTWENLEKNVWPKILTTIFPQVCLHACIQTEFSFAAPVFFCFICQSIYSALSAI